MVSAEDGTDYESVASWWKNEAPQRLAAKVRPFLLRGGTILDAGVGTGLLGEQLGGLDLVLDGVDISLEMLEKARRKRIYRNLRVGDLKQVLFTSPQYNAIISAGVFGDYLDPTYIANLLPALQDRGVIAICGTCNPEPILRLFYFSIKVRDYEYAFTVGGIGHKVFYRYVVAQKTEE